MHFLDAAGVVECFRCGEEFFLVDEHILEDPTNTAAIVGCPHCGKPGFVETEEGLTLVLKDINQGSEPESDKSGFALGVDRLDEGRI